MGLNTQIYLEYLRRKADGTDIGCYIDFYHFMRARTWQLPRH